MNFFYEATDSSGQTIMGRLDGASEGEIRQRLQQMGYQPRAIAPNPSGPAPQAAPVQQTPSWNGTQTLQALPAQNITRAASALRPQPGSGPSNTTLGTGTPVQAPATQAAARPSGII